MPIYFKPFVAELPLTIDSIGNHWQQEPTNRPKGYPFYHWLQTESGQGIVTLAGQELSLRPGEGLLIAPHVPHRYAAAGDAWTTAFLTLGGTLAGDIQKICGEAPLLFAGVPEGAYFQEWIDHTIASYADGSLDGLNLSIGCYGFLMRLSGIYASHSRSKHPLFQQYVEPVIEKIETEYAENLDVDHLASWIHVTPQYLTRLFKRFTGYSVRSYITRFRVNKAKELLIGQPYLKVQSISHLAGYHDVSYFISAFRQQTGMTPRQFRKMYGGRG